jgi:hypothetical protein
MNDARLRIETPALPLVLLPYRIETRFMDVGQSSELWLRIYPDQIAINAHQPSLSADEITAGTTYWNALWSAGIVTPPGEESRGPWRALAQRFGAPRAAYIAKQLTPTNLAARPAAPSASPTPLPAIPVLAPRVGSGDSPPYVALLPDRWSVTLYRGTSARTQVGTPITPDLAVGFTPDGPPPDPEVPVAPAMRWLVDFDTALAAGMALRIPLSADERAGGFDRIFVYGIASGASGKELGALFDAHHYTDGLSFVAQGTPTNVTPDASAAFARDDPHYDRSFNVEALGPLATPNPEGDGAAFARALGVAVATFDHVERADAFGVRNARDMLTALWPATLGYFCSQMMATTFSPAQIEAGRRFTTQFAVPRGILPAFRVGNVPYGVLPVTTVRARDDGPPVSRRSFSEALETLLARLYPTWLQSAEASSPRVNASSDPDKELMAILEMDASALRYYGRSIVGDDFLWNLLLFLTFPMGAVQTLWSAHLAAGRALLDAYGFNAWNPRVIHLSQRDASFLVTDPSVTNQPLSETDPLPNDAAVGASGQNYIAWIRNASIEDLQADAFPGPAQNALLYKLLRQSIQLDCAALASEFEIAAGRLAFSAIREPELLNVAATPREGLTAYQVLDRSAAVPGVSATWKEYFANLVPPAGSPFERLGQLRTSLARLAALPTAELDRLTAETLDMCSHRIDVWLTSLANARLDVIRSGEGQGASATLVGGFGWVHDVRPAGPRAELPRTELAAVERIDAARSTRVGRELVLRPPVAPLEDNGGYVHAPSIAQAEVAAVLRNGYMTHRGGPNEGFLSIDLSSDRVRDALETIDGIRSGQRLGALLGYRFEAGLSDPSLQKYVRPLRTRFPLVGDKATPAAPPSEAVAYDDVVDAVALREAWVNGTLGATNDWGPDLPSPGSVDRTTMLALFESLDDTMRAVSELSMAESVYQVMRGNFGRAGGLLDASSRGLHPPDAQVVTTPRTGVDVTHRLLLLFAGTPPLAPSWAASATKPRALAEPALNAWLSQQLPDPAGVSCRVNWTDGGAAGARTVTLADLALAPLDLVALSNANDRTVRSELEHRIIARAAPPASAENVTIVMVSPGAIGFDDVLTVASAWRETIGAARALASPDFAEPEKSAKPDPALLDEAELSARAKALLDAFTSPATALAAAVGALPASAATVRAQLQPLADFGISGAYAALTADDAELTLRAKPIASDVAARLATASKVPLTPATAAADALAAIAALLGNDFRVLPLVKPPDLTAFRNALAQSPGLVPPADADHVELWLQQLAHVRAGAARLDFARLTTSLLDPLGTLPKPTLVQLPVPATLPDRWLGLPFAGAGAPQSGRVALAAFASGDLNAATSFSGLLIDEWPERIPNGRETTAVAFHYEEPKARAPQALLLAVPEPHQRVWDNAALEAVLQSAFDQARARTVDLRSLRGLGQILPALYFAFNVDELTVSMRPYTIERVRDAGTILHN